MIALKVGYRAFEPLDATVTQIFEEALSSHLIMHSITRPEESKEKWTGQTGRIDEALMSEYVKDPSHTLLHLYGIPA